MRKKDQVARSLKDCRDCAGDGDCPNQARIWGIGIILLRKCINGIAPDHRKKVNKVKVRKLEDPADD